MMPQAYFVKAVVFNSVSYTIVFVFCRPISAVSVVDDEIAALRLEVNITALRMSLAHQASQPLLQGNGLQAP